MINLKQLSALGASQGQVVTFNGTTWVPATVSGGGGGGYPSGVRQVVTNHSGAIASTTTILPADGTVPQNNEGAQFFAATITPQSATSSILVIASIAQSAPYASGATVSAALFRDSASGAFAATAHGSVASGSATPLLIVTSFASGSTWPTTIKLRAGMNLSGTLYVNGFAGPTTYFGGVCASGITLIEYGA